MQPRVSAVVGRARSRVRHVQHDVSVARGPRTGGWLLDLVHRVCRDAEVRVVCPHGLRATHASLRRIVVDEAVAKIGDALGHADHGKTAKNHYVGAAATVPVLRVLAGGAGA